jgi:hypothetical protein
MFAMHRVRLVSALALLCVLAAQGRPATAQVTSLALPPDPNTGNPTTTFCLTNLTLQGTNTNLTVTPGPNPGNWPVWSITWTGTATYGSCTKPLPAGMGDKTGLPLNLKSLGTVTVNATISYYPPSGHASTNASVTITIIAPTAQMVNYNANTRWGLNQQAAIQWQLMSNGFNVGGYYVSPEEKIYNYQVPAGTAPNWNGDWGSGTTQTPYLLLQTNGLLTDCKGPNPLGGQTLPQLPAGTVFYDYTQELGIPGVLTELHESCSSG